jgi:hypothetical protein
MIARWSVAALLLPLVIAAAGCPDTSTSSDPCAGVTCAPGRVCVAGRCEASTTGCGTGPACSSGTTCVGGQCVAACGPGSTCAGSMSCCDQVCVDTSSNTAHCSGCGKACGAVADSCVASVCHCGSSAACSGGALCCLGICAVATDAGICAPAQPVCGDSKCTGAEDCKTCPGDCGVCPTSCGNGQCDSGETCQICPGDCGKCPPVCGDGSCNGTEDCNACPADCGQCPPSCGDKKCNGTEDCKSCPQDCGVCPITCGDTTCDPTETCQTCPGDCGKCACQQGQTEKTQTGCGDCQEMSRSCQTDGSWGTWGACANRCTTTAAPICLNNVCVACQPAAQENKACACGQQTRTCGTAGAWSSWGSCVTTCGAAFSCLSGNRCGKTYTSYSSAGGGDCGSQTSGMSTIYFYCEPGDFCTSASSKTCRKYETPQAGDIYTASTSAGGPECGSKMSGMSTIYYYCKPGDSCFSSSLKECSFSGTACGAFYTSYTGGGGPECGSKMSGMSTIYYYCKPGDYCSSSSQEKCKIVTSCGAGSIYHAYTSASGAQCGSKMSGMSTIYYYCKPGDTCVSSSSRECRK